MPQGNLSYQYQTLKKITPFTRYAGLPLYLDLMYATGLLDAIQQHLQARTGRQGWTDAQLVLSLILLNLIDGHSISDIELLAQDKGLCRLVTYLEQHEFKHSSDSNHPARWRKNKLRTFPSASAIFDFLKRFDAPEQDAFRTPNTAFIPTPKDVLGRLQSLNKILLNFAQQHAPQTIATLDQDATLVPTYKRQALFCYQHFKAYQPLNTYWFEQGLLVHSEFRDGNVPAGFDELRVLKEALQQLPASVKKVYLRTDGAGYQKELLRYCAEGQDERFGVIEFAISADVNSEFKKAVLTVKEQQWSPLYEEVNGSFLLTQQEWAEVCFVPNSIGPTKNKSTYRFMAIREPLKQVDRNLDEFSFPVLTMKEHPYKLFGIITNRLHLHGDEVIHWHRQRCGKSEELHKTEKEDLAGGRLPSKRFGANAAWWQIMVLAFNLEAILQRQILEDEFKYCHLKRLRRYFINQPAHVIIHGRTLIIRCPDDQTALVQWLVAMRARVLCLGQPPPVVQLG